MAVIEDSMQSAFATEVGRVFRGQPEMLAAIRRFQGCRTDLAALLPDIASYVVVVDANVLIRDLLWLLEKRRLPDVKPAILECMIAGTFVAYVTGDVVAEVERNMPAILRERGLPEVAWISHWREYRRHLKIESPDTRVVATYASGRDPSDAPTLALAEIVAACGILSADKDIAAMGGKVLPGSFKIEARSYSRDAAVYFSLKIGGIYCAATAFEALALAARGIRRGFSSFMALPPALKTIAVCAAILAILYPTSRAVLIEAVRSIGSLAGEALKVLLEVLAETNAIADAHRTVPPSVPQT